MQSIKADWDNATVLEEVSHVIVIPRANLPGPKSEIFQRERSSLQKQSVSKTEEEVQMMSSTLGNCR